MQDAVVLANALYELKSLAPTDIQAALHAYRAERFPHVKEQYNTSKINAKLIYGQVRCHHTWQIKNKGLAGDSYSQSCEHPAWLNRHF